MPLRLPSTEIESPTAVDCTTVFRQVVMIFGKSRLSCDYCHKFYETDPE